MEQKKALITGAASGIGRATAIRFASEGYDVCLNDINDEKLNEVFSLLQPGNHLLLAGSYADYNVISRGERLIQSGWGFLDTLVNCAGIYEQSHSVNSELNNWHKVFDIMVNGAFLTTKLASTLMPTGGSIIHITSIHGTLAEAGSSSYASAKAAINQYCRSAALELADKKIRVNGIAPGYVNTPMSVINGENELESPMFLDKYIKTGLLPMRRAAEPEEIAGVALFLAGNDASYITGQIIIVDGGLTITL
jgi:NAD(P)-dependent dehydrogenase (short-subunit alcohol dehydrogenase family)